MLIFLHVLVLAVAASTAAPTPAPTPSAAPTERPLREIGHVRASPYCTAFTQHFNGAVTAILSSDGKVALIDRSLDEIERHLTEVGADSKLFSDRVRLADAVDKIEAAIPRAQKEINALREGARVTQDAERATRMRDLAVQLQKTLDKHKQIAHDIHSLIGVMIDYQREPHDDFAANVNRAIGAPDLVSVAAPAIGSTSSPAANGTSLKELLQWHAELDSIDDAETQAATMAGAILSVSC